jgi:predicted GH43/DUF377 family glycosyl hydrolase
MVRTNPERILKIAILVAIVSVLAGYHSARAADSLFTVKGDTPVLHHGAQGSWNETYTDPGAVLYADGQFHMFYNGFNGWPASVQIGYATSPNGSEWTKQGNDPVLKTSQVPYAKVAALASSALVAPDGTWVLYFYTWNTFSGLLNKGMGEIGRATAPKPTGPWTADPQPVLRPGPKGAWDELRVDAPSVIHTDQGYVMYYAGASSNGVVMIGQATSTDSVHWTKYKHPTASDPQFGESSPILRPGTGDAWDAALVH